MLTVNTLEDVVTALEFINGHEILAYDTETIGLNVRQDNVIGFGVSSAIDGFYVPLLVYDATSGLLCPSGPGKQSVLAILRALQSKKLITWNASFDMRMTLNNLGVDLLPALHADVLLLKHTCDEEFPFGLKEVATKVFGTKVTGEKEEMQASIKANGGTATEYYKAAGNLLAKYCVQDCLLTFRLFSYYNRELQRQALAGFYYRDEVLPLYKEVTIPMENRGVTLDMPKLTNALNEICLDLKELEDEIQASIEPHLQLFRVWFLNKDYPLKTTTGKASGWTKKYASQFDAWKMENPDCFMFNLLSKHHLKKLFFDTLGETALNRTEPSKTYPKGQPQVDEEFLASMAPKYEWCAKLIEFNKLTKIKGTYIERLLEESENGRFYPSFLQHRTVSGRYAGDMQQLPRPIEFSDVRPQPPGTGTALVCKHTNRIREFVIPDADCVLVSADYEQLEPSIFAHTSGDPALQAVFKEGLDFYSVVAIRTENLAGVSADKKDSTYLGKVNKAARQKAKAYSLGIAYGMTGYKLKFEIGCDDATADKLVKDYLAAFPDLATWMAASKEQACSLGYVKTQSGRVRHLYQAKKLFQQYGPRIADSLQLWKDYNHAPELYKKVKADHKQFKNLLNNAINFQVQGLAASIVNRAAIKLSRELLSRGLKAGICMQVHDELVLNVPNSELSEVCELVQSVMQNIVQLSVPLRTTPQSGANFRECK
jgi:DNA polymerase-1